MVIEHSSLHRCTLLYLLTDLVGAFITIQVGSEESVFEALLAWIKYSPGTREEHLPRLLQYVRLPLLSAKYITDVVDSEVAFSFCILLLLSLLDYSTM